jgi:hypothetical protein
MSAPPPLRVKRRMNPTIAQARILAGFESKLPLHFLSALVVESASGVVALRRGGTSELRFPIARELQCGWLVASLTLRRAGSST